MSGVDGAPRIINIEQVAKFNALLLKFIQRLSSTITTSDKLSEAELSLQALFGLNPEDTTVVGLFNDIIQQASDVINGRGRAEIFQKCVGVNNVVSKEEAMNIYKSLAPEDTKICWQYIKKLWSVCQKALPASEYIPLADTPSSSPINALMKANDNHQASGEGSLVHTAFRSVCIELLNAVLESTTSDSVQASCNRSLGLIEKLPPHADDNEDKLLTVFSKFYDNQAAQGLVMDTEGTLREHGIPFVGGGKEVACQIIDGAADDKKTAIIGAAMQVGTLALTLTSLPPSVVGSMEKIAQLFCQKVADGDMKELDLQNLDPIALMSLMAEAGIGDEVSNLLSSFA